MDKNKQTRIFSSNLIIPNISIFIYDLPTSFVVSQFIFHPINSWDKKCEIMAKAKGTSIKYPQEDIVAPSYTLALKIYEYKTIELNSIIFLFTKLLLPNIIHWWKQMREIRLPHLNIKIFEILRLSEVLIMKSFYWNYKSKLDVDLEK